MSGKNGVPLQMQIGFLHCVAHVEPSKCIYRSLNLDFMDKRVRLIMKSVDILVFIFRIKYKPILSASLDVFEFFTRQDLSTLKVLRATAVRGYPSIKITSTLSFYLFL